MPVKASVIGLHCYRWCYRPIFIHIFLQWTPKRDNSGPLLNAHATSYSCVIVPWSYLCLRFWDDLEILNDPKCSNEINVRFPDGGPDGCDVCMLLLNAFGAGNARLTYWLKSAPFSNPSLIRHPSSLCSHSIFAVTFTVSKLESWDILQWRPHDRSLSNFDTLPAGDGRIGRQIYRNCPNRKKCFAPKFLCPLPPNCGFPRANYAGAL